MKPVVFATGFSYLGWMERISQIDTGFGLLSYDSE